MSKTSTITKTFKTPEASFVITSETVVSDSFLAFDATVQPGATEEIDVAITVANIEAWGMNIAKPAGTTGSVSGMTAVVKTNSTSAPANTINLNGTNGVGWSKGDGINGVINPLTTNITKLYVTNSGSIAVTFQFNLNYNTSPQSIY